MNWNLEWSEKALKNLAKMDRQKAKIIVSWMRSRVEGCENLRLLGKELVGNQAGKWRYRIGDYRVLVLIQDEKMTVLAIGIGHRKDVYR